jgi:hypothetical protein
MLAVLAVIVVVGAVGRYLRSRRAADIRTIAARAGLDYAAEDPFDCTRVSFPLFRRGDGRGAENVLWRQETGEPGAGPTCRAFDYFWYTEHRGENGEVARTYHRYSCALALHGGNWPELTVEPEGLGAKMRSAVAGGDIDFESEEFNRLFCVRCEDRRFASTLIDPQMLDFLLSTKGALSFAVRGRWLLVWSKPLKPVLVPALVKVAEGFVDRIPKVTWDLYPSPFVDAEGVPLPVAGDPLSRIAAQAAVEELRERTNEDEPWATLADSPFEALERDDGVEYDLDGHLIPEGNEDPWGNGRPSAGPPPP